MTLHHDLKVEKLLFKRKVMCMWVYMCVSKEATGFGWWIK